MLIGLREAYSGAKCFAPRKTGGAYVFIETIYGHSGFSVACFSDGRSREGRKDGPAALARKLGKKRVFQTIST
jgi:hypothetical protein